MTPVELVEIYDRKGGEDVVAVSCVLWNGASAVEVQPMDPEFGQLAARLESGSMTGGLTPEDGYDFLRSLQGIGSSLGISATPIRSDLRAKKAA